MSNYVPIVLTVSEILSIYIKRGDITTDVAAQLKLQYSNTENDKRKLLSLLFEFMKDRLHFMMLESYDELDKKGQLTELKDKYLLGFMQKYYMRFGVEYGSSDKPSKKNNEGEMLLDFAIDQNIIDAAFENNLRTVYAQDGDSNKLYKRVIEAIQQYVNRFEKEKYDQIKASGKLDLLKTIYTVCFLQKYLEKFGFEYRESK